MSNSNANKLFSEFKSSKDFDAEVKRLQAEGVEPKRESKKRKSSCTPMQWAQNLVYLQNIAHKESTKKRRIENRAEKIDAYRQMEREWSRRNRLARNARTHKENFSEDEWEARLKKARDRYWANPEAEREARKKQRQKNPQAHRDAVARYRAKNPTKGAEYYQKNKTKVADRMRLRRQRVPELKIRAALAEFSRRLPNPKATSGRKHCGMSIPELRDRFEGMWEDGMTWDNYGTVWEMDHWMPLICDDVDLLNPIHCRALAHYTNLQPLTRSANRQKANDVYPEAKANFLRLVKQYESESTPKEGVA